MTPGPGRPRQYDENATAKSINLPDSDWDQLDTIQHRHGFKSRSMAVHHLIKQYTHGDQDLKTQLESYQEAIERIEQEAELAKQRQRSIYEDAMSKNFGKQITLEDAVLLVEQQQERDRLEAERQELEEKHRKEQALEASITGRRLRPIIIDLARAFYQEHNPQEETMRGGTHFNTWLKNEHPTTYEDLLAYQQICEDYGQLNRWKAEGQSLAGWEKDGLGQWRNIHAGI